MSTPNRCPNCNKKVGNKPGSNMLIYGNSAKTVNDLSEGASDTYCFNCVKRHLETAQKKLKEELADLNSQLGKLLHAIPISSIPSPKGWDYTVLGIVTGQSVTGTGFFSEFTASIADLVGGQAHRFNRKLNEGENSSFTQMRRKALMAKGNAIVGVDVDYSEVGGVKGMLMVCATGTVIQLRNTEVLNDDQNQHFPALKQLGHRLNKLEKASSVLERVRKFMRQAELRSGY